MQRILTLAVDREQLSEDLAIFSHSKLFFIYLYIFVHFFLLDLIMPRSDQANYANEQERFGDNFFTAIFVYRKMKNTSSLGSLYSFMGVKIITNWFLSAF